MSQNSLWDSSDMKMSFMSSKYHTLDLCMSMPIWLITTYTEDFCNSFNYK
jgi:hypothetical protein